MSESDGNAQLPPLRDVIERHGLNPKKSLGQNFLLDQNITDKIVRLAGDLSDKHIIEIGPGPGGLTRSILQACPISVTAIETDDRAISVLEELQAVYSVLSIVHDDALKVDVSNIALAPRVVIANLPYNIATPLLIGWLKKLREDHDAIASMMLMFQKEVADRITARPGTKQYGRLSVMAQWMCAVDTVYILPPSAFTPPPKVNSAVVRFSPKTHDKGPSFKAMETLTAAAFGNRRKMLRSSLKPYREHMKKCGIDDTLRAENLTVDDFVRLAKVI